LLAHGLTNLHTSLLEGKKNKMIVWRFFADVPEKSFVAQTDANDSAEPLWQTTSTIARLSINLLVIYRIVTAAGAFD
jgi:hypothetical protein